jgi:SOS-response transcriptional repressor LexA
MEALGPKLRRQRRRLGFTLDELSAKAAISKPYLSLIETGRVTNPPSDEKLRRLEEVLQFRPGELITQAHLQRTPRDVRAVLVRLMNGNRPHARADQAQGINGNAAANGGHAANSAATTHAALPMNGHGPASGKTGAAQSPAVARAGASVSIPAPLNLDDAYLSGVLAELVDRHRGNIDPLSPGGNAVPVINKVQAGYPQNFTDLSYPRGVADDYVSCPGIADPDAFAARVHGDSMSPKYRQGDIVIFSPAADPRAGDDCFVRIEDGQTTFKQVFFETEASGRAVIRLQPRNPRYRPQTIPREQISGLYRAVYRYQRVDEG